jgi:alkanesulfonate monooxygenase SsuD/methylene tetrahydromethanopterin reductase-like flavin-dependent oxidoreductase (luciferase family)
MDVGIQLIFSSGGWESITDGQVYAEEVALARQAEDLGFDAIWPVEHHFFDYSFCPDNLEFLAYLAGCTSSIGLGTAAIILPWNEPLRVAEKVSMLDHLSNGRVRLGFGRGLSVREYAPFRGIEMEESRGRFDESAQMIVDALETGFIEGSGPYYEQPRVEIRPRPELSFAGRVYAVANSSDSVASCAKIGGRMIMFAETNWEKRMESIERHRTLFLEHHGVAAPPPMTADFCYVHPDADHAKEVAEEHLARYLTTILNHYELMSDHFDDMEGYQGYGRQAELLRKIGFEGYVKGFLASNAYGTPDQILERFRERYEIIGDFELATCFRFGGIDFKAAEDSMKLYAKEILPELQSWGAGHSTPAVTGPAAGD